MAKRECPNCGKPIDVTQFGCSTCWFAQFGCSTCWFKLPPELRRRFWTNYRKPFPERLRGLPELYAEAMTVWQETPHAAR